jgi:Ca2+-transporting ATPase
VPGLLQGERMGAHLVRGLAGQPGIVDVRPNLLTGRVLIHYEPNQVHVSDVEAMVWAVATGQEVAVTREPGEEAPVGAPPAEPVAAEDPAPAAEPWHALDLAEASSRLKARIPRGLTQAEADQRRETYGPNRLRAGKEVSLGEVILGQLKNPITLLLLGAGGLSLAVAQWLEGAAALGIAGMTTYLGVRQETRANNALASLGRLAAPRAVVEREGTPLVVPAEEVVPGDLILLEEGDRVPADARLVFSAGLQVDESALTGESLPVVKDRNLRCTAATPLAERANMLYSGTTVISGRAQALVVATGMYTEVGRVAKLLEEGFREVTPLQRRLQALARWIFWGILGVGAAGTFVAVARGLPLSAALAQSVSVAVSAMPQGLPVTVTIALSTAVARLAEQGAMTRRLGAMESLGSTTIICSDKTGTLTCNRLSVRELKTGGAAWELTDGLAVRGGQFRRLNGPGDGPDQGPAPDPLLRELLEAAALCTNARIVPDGAQWKVEGDATEGALLAAAHHAHIDTATLRQNRARIHEVPFSSERRRMSVVCQTGDGPALYVKGAPETVMPMCSYLRGEGGDEPLTPELRKAWLQEAEAMAARGLRVLAVAWRRQEKPVVAAEKGLVLLGFAGMADSPRPGVPAAVRRCHEAGIKVLMLTGDHPATAAAIGREVGLLRPDSLVLTGPQLDAMSDAELAAAADRLAICARVAPEHKLRVVRMLKRQGHVVAMTGDGVNDAPALQAADTGIAMGVAGTEVTRGAANLVLTDDDFASIVRAVEQGRSAFGNIRRALTYSLSTNGGEALMALLPLAVGLALPVPAAMLLITNMLCDGLISLSLATDQPEPGVMKRPPRPLGEPVLGEKTMGKIAVRSVAIGASTVALYTIGVGLTGNPGIGYSMALAGLVASKLLYARHVRRESLDGTRVTPRRNTLLDVATTLGAGVTAAAIYLPGLNGLFAMAPLGPVPAGVVALVVWGQHRVATALSHRTLPGPEAPRLLPAPAA